LSTSRTANDEDPITPLVKSLNTLDRSTGGGSGGWFDVHPLAQLAVALKHRVMSPADTMAASPAGTTTRAAQNAQHIAWFEAKPFPHQLDESTVTEAFGAWAYPKIVSVVRAGRHSLPDSDTAQHACAD
jgi:hypothetical protein